MIIENRVEALAKLVSLCEPFAEPALATRGSYQSEVAKVVGTITTAGNAKVIVTADAMAHPPKTVSVAVALNDTAYDVATKIRAALAAVSDIASFFDISGTGINIILTTKDYDDNDATMNISIADDTCVGLTAAPTSAAKVSGSLGDLSEVEAILDNNLLGRIWAASTLYAAGDTIYPTKQNGHRYRVVSGGTSGATEPELWPKGTDEPYIWNSIGEIINGTVTFKEDGPEFGIGYDLDAATREAWDKKMAKASEFVSTPGIDMSKIFDKCSKMRDRFDTVVMA